MDPSPDAATPPPSAKGMLLRAIVPLAILAGGWIGFKVLSTEQAHVQHPPPEPRVIRTRVIKLERADHQSVIRTQGVVRPHNTATLTPQVSGKVAVVSESLHDGAFFAEGDVLLELDDDDFETEVLSAEAQLARAEALLSQEEAKAKQARLNWEDLGYTEEPNELVLRLPQLREAKANREAAQAALDRSQRDLSRTKIRAPFDGRVLQREVAVGQSVTPGTALASVYMTVFVEVRLPIAARQQPFVTLPQDRSDPPVEVELSDALTETSNTTWKGSIVGTEGALDESSRELFAIARINDPFSRQQPEGGRKPPLRIGQPVHAAISGKVLENVLEIPRSAVRKLNRIYIVDEETKLLTRHEVEAVWSDVDHLYIRSPDIPDGALLATTRMVYAPNVSRVEILPDPVEPESGEDVADPQPAAGK